MKIYGIDISLISTAIVSSEYEYFSFMKNYKDNNKWIKLLKNFVNFIPVDDINDELSYSKLEVEKLRCYNKNASMIVEKIKSENSFIYIEGYNYSKKPGPIIELVTFSTLIRNKILLENSNLNIISPKTLKLNSCLLAYKDKKNDDDISGGNFSKFDMFNALIKYNPKSPLNNFIIEHYDELSILKMLPKPIDDLLDAEFLMHTHHE